MGQPSHMIKSNLDSRNIKSTWVFEHPLDEFTELTKMPSHLTGYASNKAKNFEDAKLPLQFNS